MREPAPQVALHRCVCGRLPTLGRMGTRSHLIRYTCACGLKGVNAREPGEAARHWNAETATRRIKASQQPKDSR